MATIGKDQVKVVGVWGMPGLQAEIRQGPEGASQTYIKGALLKWSSGLLIAAVADDNDLAGVAAEAGKNVASGGTARFYPLVNNLLLEFTLLEAAAANHVSVAGDRGAVYGYQISTNVYLDTSEVTNGLFRVVAIPGTDYAAAGKGVVGDTNIRVLAVPVVATTAF